MDTINFDRVNKPCHFFLCDLCGLCVVTLGFKIITLVRYPVAVASIVCLYIADRKWKRLWKNPYPYRRLFQDETGAVMLNVRNFSNKYLYFLIFKLAAVLLFSGREMYTIQM